MIYRNTFGQAESDTTIITPTSNKKLYISDIIIDGNATLNFLSSAVVVSSGEGGKGGCFVDKLGATDEVLSITCTEGTTVTVNYEELD